MSEEIARLPPTRIIGSEILDEQMLVSPPISAHLSNLGRCKEMTPRRTGHYS